jgi:hypothetical protein
MQKFEKAVSLADINVINGLWAILKYQDLGILKKILSMCRLLNLNEDEVIRDLPQNEDGRILDKPSRHVIHDILIKYSNFVKE